MLPGDMFLCFKPVDQLLDHFIHSGAADIDPRAIDTARHCT